MKKSIAISIVLILALTLTTKVFAQTGEQGLINPYYLDEITVFTDDELILTQRWGACTSGLIKAWINVSTYEWYLNDIPISIAGDHDNYWGPIEFGGSFPNCLAGPGTGWNSYWRYSIGSLPESTYIVRLTISSGHKFLDGGDYDGDGKIDIDDWPINCDVTIHVVEP